MSDTAVPEEAGSSTLTPEQREELIRSLGAVFNDMVLYGPEHKVTAGTIQRAYDALAHHLAGAAPLSLCRTDEGLLVNGAPVVSKNPLVRAVADRLARLDIDDLAFAPGLRLDEFRRVLQLLTSKPEEIASAGGFASAASLVGLSHVQAAKFSYQRVAEHEVVVSAAQTGVQETAAPTATDAAPQATKAADATRGGSGKEEEFLSESNVQSILAFLKGEASASGEAQAEKALQHLASDARKLGELILRAAEIAPQLADTASGATLSDMVVGCLRRACDGISKSPTMRTPTAKKNLSKTLMLMERELLDMMRNVSQDVTEADRKAVTDMIAGLVDELKMDSLATEYVKKLNAVSTCQKRLIRYISAKGRQPEETSELETRLVEEGLSRDGWQELLVKSSDSKLSGGGGLGPGGGDSAAAVAQLALLIAEIDRRMARQSATPGAPAPEIHDLTGQVQSEVDRLAVGTEKKIAALPDELPQKEVEQQRQRRKMLDLLAEIAQELCQPLAVVNSSVEMIHSERVGALSTTQKELLALAAASGQRLELLIDKLRDISGLPSSLSPDETALRAIYRPGRGAGPAAAPSD